MQPETERLKKRVRVQNPNGLHMRPAIAFSQKANQFNIDVEIINGSNRANGKSPMEIMLLMALPGAELELELSGPDAAKAMDTLCELIEEPGEPH